MSEGARTLMTRTARCWPMSGLFARANVGFGKVPPTQLANEVRRGARLACGRSRAGGQPTGGGGRYVGKGSRDC